MDWRGIPDDYQNKIITGDAFQLGEKLPDKSIDLILCDPVYWAIDQYAWVARLAERVLVEGGNIVVQCGLEYRYQVETAMRETSLFPRPLLCEVFTGGNARMWMHRSFNCWHPYVWFSNGKDRYGAWMRDMMRGGGRAKGLHEWGDSDGMFTALIERLSPVGGIVLDPFTGSGTVPSAAKMLLRNYVAFELDAEYAESARERVAKTPEPLFVLKPSQLELEVFDDSEL